MANETPAANGSQNHDNVNRDQPAVIAMEPKAIKSMAYEPLPLPKPNGLSNGTTNNTRHSSQSYASTSRRWGESSVSFPKDQQVTVLQETVVTTRRKFVEDFDDVNDADIRSLTIEGFLQFIERQRLTHMPHRGSRWDKVLKWAEFFALQISGYSKAVKGFVRDSDQAAKLIWAAACALLELGPSNAQALDKTFAVFYELGLSISVLLRHDNLLHADEDIRMEVGQAFNDLLMLVRDVSIYYYAQVNAISAGQVSLDFNSTFGGRIEALHKRRSCITDAMWQHELGDDASMDVETLRAWLRPRDRNLQTLVKNRVHAPGHRDEYTCEWFQRHLLDFSRSTEDGLAIVGPAGCGKSVLSRWIIERLQRPLGKKTYETLFFTVEADVPSETSSVAIAKHLLLQLLEKNVGDKLLFQDLAQAYDKSLSKDASNLEDSLWKSLDIALGRFASRYPLFVTIDGLDEVKGGEQNRKQVTDRLGALAAKHTNIQTVVLSRDPAPKPTKGKIQTFKITHDHTHDDCRHVAEHALHGYEHYQRQGEHAREAVVDQLIHAANGNFLGLLLTIKFLRQEKSHEGFMKAAKAAKDAPKSLDELIKKLVDTLKFSSSDTSHLLSWMLVAERPFSITEVKNLLQIDLQKKHSVDRKTDIREDIKASLGALVVIDNGFVRFRHPAIRAHMLNFQKEGKKVMSYQAAQTDITMRLLAYCRFNLTNSRDPALEMMATTQVNELFQGHRLLEYAVRYWNLHFHASSMYTGADNFQLPADFKAIFPSSTQLAMLEWTCWDSLDESIKTHELARRIRQDVFTEKHESVLQSLIICGSLYQKWSKTTEASMCFYRASHIGQGILRENHTVTIGCTTTFLTITETIKTTTRTELATCKEGMLKYIINAYKHQHGKTHDLVIRYYKVLAQLYVDIREEHNAETIWRELREIIIARYGKGSEEETSISEQITVILKKSDKKKDVAEYETDVFDIAMHLEVWDIRRIQMTIELAVSYEARGEYFLAEELYVTMWRRLTEQCHHPHHHHGVEIHLRTIDIVLEYVRFLRRRHRHEEASNVLICVWTEYEEYDFESETVFLRLKAVGELMRAISLLSVAISVFKKCWGWFKSHGMHEHTESCEVLISETMTEIISTTSTTTVSTSSTATTTTTTERAIKELFESTMSRTTVTSETFSICKSLISYYMKTEQWSQCIEITKRSLLLVWKTIISERGAIALPKDFGSEAIDIAISLAICYTRSHRFHEAEEIYVRIYRACRNSCHIHDERLTRSCTVLIRFYEEHRHWHKMIEIYRELLVEYRKHLGTSHTLTIKTLYMLGSLCAEHGHGHAHEYYEDIIATLNHGSAVCHHDALDAMFFMFKYHDEGGHWHKLQTTCKTLWLTWKDQHHGYKNFSVEFIEVLYLRYRYVLEHHIHCEFSVLRDLTIEYRNACIKIFGASATITIKASIELAQIYMKSEKYIHEAMSIYEEVLTMTRTSTTQIPETTITTIRLSLTKGYVKVCSHNSVSKSTIERATKVVLERFNSLKATIGCSHIETLSVLRELVLLYLKLGSHSIVVRMLLETTIEIIKKEKHSKTLHEAAKTMGSIYIACGMIEQGHEMIHEMRLQIITGSASSDKSSFKLDKPIGKICYVFLVTFEQTILGQMAISYSEIMADLLTETILYESLTRSINNKSNTEVILARAGGLRAFLVSRKRRVQIDVLDHQAHDNFVNKWGSTLKVQSEASRIFCIGLLEELGHHDTQHVNIGHSACVSSVAKVQSLLSEGRIQQAYDVALCALNFINQHRAYHQLQNVEYGIKLSELMAGRGLEKPLKSGIDTKVRNEMMELSRKIIHDVLQACKDSKLDFVRFRLSQLNRLIGLLGKQKSHIDLEWLLNLLWSSREVQKTWSSNTIISIGRLYVQATYANQDHRALAIRLCEDICYNLRRVWGSLDPKTLEMSELLSQLYTSMGHHREAMGVHENILRLVVEGDDGDDSTVDTMESARVRMHVEWLKQCHLRLQGWDKSAATYRDLVDAILHMEPYAHKPEWQNVRGTEHWDKGKEAASDSVGKFAVPTEWKVDDDVETAANKKNKQDDYVAKKENGNNKTITYKRSGLGMKRATSNCGLNHFGHVLNGGYDEEKQHHHQQSNGNGAEKAESAKPLIFDGEDDGYESAAEEVGQYANGDDGVNGNGKAKMFTRGADGVRA